MAPKLTECHTWVKKGREVGLLPWKRGVGNHGLSNARQSTWVLRGRARGCLAGLLSCLPRCPTCGSSQGASLPTSAQLSADA